MRTPPARGVGLKRFLPPVGSAGYHLLLGTVAMFVLGPLGGISAAFMNFSIGFFVGGQVLAGILGSAVTLSYGPEGKHGANCIQTLSASVAGMCGMGVLMQAMAWLGLPEPPLWQLVLYFLCIGMFGVGVGMLYTPILVDRMRLMYPSGFAVANILRALTDPRLLRPSIAKLGGGMFGGLMCGLAASRLALLERIELSASSFGAGMIVGARIALPAIVVAILGDRLKPYLVEVGWLEPGAPFRKIGFIIALGTILGAAMVDIALILYQGWQRWRQTRTAPATPPEDWRRVNLIQLVLWVVFWGAGIVLVGSRVLHQPVFFLVVAVLLCFVFVLVNGISLGISDSNPISSAFVLTVFILAALGLKDAGVGLMCASVLLIACSEGGDMQQDRSTGWRLGTHRIVQFRYQVAGIVMGAVLAVVLARTFMSAYPVLKLDQFSQQVEGAERWQSAMTYKFVGALKDITQPKPHVMRALELGVALGLIIELARKALRASARYRRFATGSRTGRVTDFVLDAFLLASPYASSFGGFVELRTCMWWAAGGVLASVYDWAQARRNSRQHAPATDLPPDMSTTSLIGGGLIAGDSLAALGIGLYGLARTVL